MMKTHTFRLRSGDANLICLKFRFSYTRHHDLPLDEDPKRNPESEARQKNEVVFNEKHGVVRV